MTSRLREFVQVQKATTAADGFGGQLVTWATETKNVPCAVRPVRGNEQELHERRVTVETFLVRLRYGVTVTTAHRLLWGARVLDIKAVQDRDGDRRYLTLECELDTGPE